jgi:uncharacterized membrane protein YqjE
MKPLLQKNFISIMFVIVLTALGISIASLVIFELSDKQRLAFILIAVSCFLTSLSFYIEILNRRRRDKS